MWDVSLENRTTTGCEPGIKLFAAGKMVPLTVAAGPPATSNPLVGDSETQSDVLVNDQLKLVRPRFVNVNETGLGEKGPPDCPATSAFAGLINKSSGTSNAWTRPMVVELDGDLALRPIPRFANAAHNSGKSAPPF